MTCEAARALLHPYADGELDLMRSLEVEEHLSGCAACAREAATIQALRSTIGEAAHYYAAPTRLEARVRAMAHEDPHPARDLHLPPFGWGLIAAAAAVALFAIWFKGGPLGRPDTTSVVAREVVADHVRSLMAAHLTDVLSSNQHTVKPWFEGKLDFSPRVEDLTPHGFTLVGGRLDFLDNRAVAAIVYQRRAHVINLFVWPLAQPADAAAALEALDGYNIVHWTKAGMSYWAASSLNARELLEFAADLRKTVATRAPSPSAN